MLGGRSTPVKHHEQLSGMELAHDLGKHPVISWRRLDRTLDGLLALTLMSVRDPNLSRSAG
jgi:hypothetical protein